MDNHENIGFYFSKAFWDPLRKNKIDKEWSETLDFLLDWGVEITSEYTADIGSYTVWIGNYPFAYGSKFSIPQNIYTVGEDDRLPTKRVQYKLYKAVEAAKRKK